MSEAIVRVEIFDTTLRDGAQALPDANQFPEGSKPEIAELIASLGVNVIEAGFPRTKGDDVEVRNVAKTVGNTRPNVSVWSNGEEAGLSAFRPPVITGLSRTTNEDIEATWDAVQYAARPRIHTFISTDPEHMRAKFVGKTAEQVLGMGQHAVRYAKEISSEHPNASVEFSAEAASTTEWTFLERVVKTAADEGADVINVPDTVGQRTPFWMANFYGNVIDWAHSINPDIVISAHNHNDLDMATANSLSLVEIAARVALQQQREIKVQIETALCGLGERAGNADVFPVVANLFKNAKDMDSMIRWEFNPGMSKSVAQRVMSFAGLEVHRQSPVVGEDTNVHRSGIHSDGVIKGGFTIYSPIDLSFWGHEKSARHEDGKYQGKNGRSAANQTAQD